MKYITISPLMLFFPFFQACNKQTVCTEVFNSVQIAVTGKLLTDFYTNRESTGEKIQYPKSNLPVGAFSYTVLDDTYQKNLAGKQDTFWFKGYINDSLVVNEPFVIKADKCHIEYVSGNVEVAL